MKTTFMAKAQEIESKGYLVDAAGQTVGLLAAEVAKILRGKNKPIFTPHVDTGDFVVIINADKVQFSGKKLKKKMYIRYTGYMGGRKETSAEEMLQKFPERVLEHAIKVMLPKNKLGADMFRKLHVYTGDKHPHAAQKPEPISFDIKKVGGKK